MHTERLRTMIYYSPGRKKFELEFDSLSRKGGKKAPVSEYPGQNQGGVQDLGEITGVFPITCYITGTDYDLEADRFWEALAESGPGKLVHPRWGNLQVLPVSREQKEEFVDGLGRAVFTIEFLKVSDKQFIYPKINVDESAKVIADADLSDEAILENVPEGIKDTKSLTEILKSVTTVTDAVRTGFNTITGITDEIRSKINETVNTIESGIDSLILSPAALMESVLRLYNLPADITADIQAKLSGYKTIYTNIANGFINSTKQYGEEIGRMAACSIAGVGISAARATATGSIPTRKQAGEIITSLNELQESLRDTLQEIETYGGFTISYSLILALEQVFSSALNNLVSRTLDLPAERTMVTEGEVCTFLLCRELMGNINRFDEFLSYNNFQDNQIFMLDPGTEVKWYV